MQIECRFGPLGLQAPTLEPAHAVLAGDREAATGIHGDRRPLGLLERWIARAQQPGAER